MASTSYDLFQTALNLINDPDMDYVDLEWDDDDDHKQITIINMDVGVFVIELRENDDLVYTSPPSNIITVNNYLMASKHPYIYLQAEFASRSRKPIIMIDAIAGPVE